MKVFGSSFSRFGVLFAIGVISFGVVAAPNMKNGGANPGAEPVLKGDAAFGDWRSDHPGVMRLITAADLPKPYASASARNQPRVVAQPEGAWPQVLPGFKIERLATGIRNPRLLRTAPNGDIFIADSEANQILVMHGVGQGSGTIAPQVFATGLVQPFGIAFYPPGPNPKYIYIGNTGSVVRFPYSNGDLKASGPSEMIVSNIPSGGRLTGGGHWTRDVIFSADGKKMFVSVGSHSNVTDDAQEVRRADILEFNPDGTGEKIYASGIRNPVGITFNPTTGVLWASVNERDEIGDNLPPDYITHVQEGGFYGWPWFYIGSNEDPRLAGKHPELKDKVIVPDVLVQPHSASLEMIFYTGNQFPAEYRGDAFAAEHGSWNRDKRTGYKIIRVPMKNGKATGEYEDFVTGFVAADENVWGRPVGVTVAADGSLIFSDDGSNSIWRVSYSGDRQPAGKSK
jgi:glucose/arabinose dehydrogenase|nr:sorbosone dehydrogenase family protein [Candidatus Acidoferrales bacterium]